MKSVYRTAKVIFDAHQNQYDVYYRSWFIWHWDSGYKVNQYTPDAVAKEQAIRRAQGLLNTVEVWRQSNIDYYY